MKIYYVLLIGYLFFSSSIQAQDCDGIDIIQTSNITTNDVIAAAQTLTATNQILGSSIVTYQAGDYVLLKGGFFVNGAARLLAKTENCEPVSSNDLEINGFQLKLGENPTNSITQIEYTLDNRLELDIRLLDVLGHTIKTISPMQNVSSGIHRETIDLSDLVSGNYFLHFYTSSGKRNTYQLIKI